MTWFPSPASGNIVPMLAMLRQPKYATITASASPTPQTVHRHCICASSAPMRYTGSMRIWSLAIYFIPCSRFPWCARTRTAAPTRSLPFPFASPPSAPVTMEIIPYAIVPSVIAIVITHDVVVIMLSIAACNPLGKWIPRCRCIWSNRWSVCCAKRSHCISSQARNPHRRPRKMDQP